MAVFFEHPCGEYLNCRGIRSIVVLLGVLCAWPRNPACLLQPLLKVQPHRGAAPDSDAVLLQMEGDRDPGAHPES
jgi:hypothetical protein